MKDQFVTYEIAKLLFELGFNERCLAWFYPKTKEFNLHGYSMYVGKETIQQAPLWQQAIAFLNNELHKNKSDLVLCPLFTDVEVLEQVTLKGIKELQSKMKKQTINTDSYAVKVVSAPISERYWSAGCEAKVEGNQIRVGGAWFDFDARWVVTKQR